MEYRLKSTFELRNKRNLYNTYYNKNINQSPKIYSNKIRILPEEKKLFSLVDINEKITNSKGTSLPDQFKRLSQEEINKRFGNDKLIGWNYSKLLINKYIKRVQTSKSFINSRNLIDKYDLQNTENNIDNNKTTINKKSQPKITTNKESNNLNKIEKKEIINSYRGIEKNGTNKNQYIIPSTKRNDKWMPKNYQNYELLVKNPNLLYHKLKDDSTKRKMAFLNSKEISKKMNETDIFFVKNQIISKNILNKKNDSSNLYTDSDIFCMKNDIVNLSKCGETYLFKSNSSRKYTTANESNSKWKPKSNMPNFMNYPSTDFNILCPNKINYIKTKPSIIEECKNKVKNNDDPAVKKNIYFNPTHKQKGLGEFIDITQNGSGNPGREFIKIFKENPFCCQKNSDVCAAFGDIHIDYNHTCTKPFMKERF